jgi:hypothetical protein
VAGRVLVALGLAVAFSALWMTQFYHRQPGTGELTYVFRLTAGSGMAASIILGFAAIRRGDLTRHQAWMTRAYALALGAGTQVFTQKHRQARLRRRPTRQRPPARRRLGHQPRRSGIRHPAARKPPGRQGNGGDPALITRSLNDSSQPGTSSGSPGTRTPPVCLIRRPHPTPQRIPSRASRTECHTRNRKI